MKKKEPRKPSLEAGLRFRIKGSGFDGRKKYTIKEIAKRPEYYGGYLVKFNETKAVVSIGVMIDEFSTKIRRIVLP